MEGVELESAFGGWSCGGNVGMQRRERDNSRRTGTGRACWILEEGKGGFP